MFEERPDLWDISSEHYRDKDKRQESWLEIASAMDTDVHTVERKMKMLVSQYRRELFTKRNSRWFAFQRLSFLKTRQLAVSQKKTLKMDINMIDLMDLKDLDILETSRQSQRHRHRIRKRPPCFVSMDQRRVEQTSKPNLHGDALRIEKQIVKDRLRHRSTQERDEYTTYGELVAMKLKKIGNSYARSTAQYHINSILYKAEIGAYDKDPTQSKPYNSKEHFGGGCPSEHHNSNNDDESQSSSSSKSLDLKFEEIESDE